jgi:hypothetical protein
VSGWFLRLFAKSAVTVDGSELPASWGVPCELSVTPDAHRVTVGVRYRRGRRVLGTGVVEFGAAPGNVSS